jgi:hypothetical protein
MIGCILILATLVALTQARAIVTNHCPYDVYISSVPQVLSSSLADNLLVKPHGQYQEPWRHGSAAMPGIAIKVSPLADGVYKHVDELDFAYTIDPGNKAKVWVDLSVAHPSSVQGMPFQGNLTFHACNGVHTVKDVLPYGCDATDDVELVLCDTKRTTALKDPKPLDQIQACYDYHDVSTDRPDDSDSSSDDDFTSPADQAANPSTVQRDDKKLFLSPCLAQVIYPAKRTTRTPRVPPGPTIARSKPLTSLENEAQPCPRCNARTTLEALQAPSKPICLAAFCEKIIPDLDCAEAYNYIKALLGFFFDDVDIDDYVDTECTTARLARRDESDSLDEFCDWVGC